MTLCMIFMTHTAVMAGNGAQTKETTIWGENICMQWYAYAIAKLARIMPSNGFWC